MNPHLERAGQFLSDTEHAERVNYKFKNSCLVYRGNELVGAVKYASSLSDLELIQMQVDSPHQGAGYGTEIIHALLKEHGGKTIKLNVLKESPALRFYKRHGFQITGEDEHEFQMQKN